MPSPPLSKLTPSEARQFARQHCHSFVQAIFLRMRQRDLRNSDLVPLIGTRARVSEVLNRKRGLTVRMIRALHLSLAIPLEHLCEIEKKDMS